MGIKNQYFTFDFSRLYRIVSVIVKHLADTGALSIFLLRGTRHVTPCTRPARLARDPHIDTAKSAGTVRAASHRPDPLNPD